MRQKITVVACDVADCTVMVEPEHHDGISFKVTHSNWPSLEVKKAIDLCPRHSAELRNLLKLPKD